MLLQGHFQNAYVTRDLDRALALFRENYGVDGFRRMESRLEVSTPTGSGLAVMKLALAWVGKLQYELIEPVSGPVEIYRDALPADGSARFHHICMRRADDWERTRAMIKHNGLPIVLEGATEKVKFLYADARDTLGHYLEYAWMPPAVWAAMAGG